MKTETRPETIIRVTRDWARGRGEWLKLLTLNVIDAYHARVPAADRGIRFMAGADALKNLANDKKFIERCMNGEVRFPAELEEAWVMALPDPFRTRLISELAHRYGLMPVYEHQVPVSRETIVHGARLMLETSEALQAVAQIEADGVVDCRDHPFIEDAVRELDDVASVAVTMKYYLSACLVVDGTHTRAARHAPH